MKKGRSVALQRVRRSKEQKLHPTTTTTNAVTTDMRGVWWWSCCGGCPTVWLGRHRRRHKKGEESVHVVMTMALYQHRVSHVMRSREHIRVTYTNI